MHKIFASFMSFELTAIINAIIWVLACSLLRWKNVNLHSEMILKQKELNAAKTAPRYAGSKAGNAVKMRSTPLNVSRKRVQELLAINAGLDRTSRPLHDMAQQNPHRGPPGTELQVKNALSFRKNGMF